MGFGSYHESEQETPSDRQEDAGESVSVHENEHDGAGSFETGVSTDDLVDRLGEIKDGSTE
ncbi:MAG: DUF5786 family protein [Halobacteriaceae archaeon]